jgi:hypothetical protein
MTFSDCFLINPQILAIIANISESNYQIIRITFNENITNPTLITGEVNLKNNQIPHRLLLTNVKEIEIQFSPKVWEN